MIKSATLLLVLALAYSSAASADDFAGKSPSGNLAFASKDEMLYIWPTANPNERVILYKEDVLSLHAAAISPDDAWVALEDGGGSAGHTILFFKRQNGFKWKQVGDADSVDSVEIVGNAALQSKGIKGDLDHSYLHPVEWSGDSKWLTVELDARGETDDRKQHVQITEWRCRYNPTSQAVELVQGNPGKIDITEIIEESGESTPPPTPTPTPFDAVWSDGRRLQSPEQHNICRIYRVASNDQLAMRKGPGLHIRSS